MRKKLYKLNEARDFACAAVVHSSRFIYDRFVTDRRFCAVTQTTRPAFIETTDAAFCPVGYRCQEPNLTPFAR